VLGGCLKLGGFSKDLKIWLSQETSKILPSDGVISYTGDSLCEGRAGAGVFSNTLEIRESYALGSLATVFPSRGICNSRPYWLLSEREHAQHDAKLCCWLYPHIQFHLHFYTSAGNHCKISLITTGWDCFACQVTATLRAMRRLIGWRGWARTLTFVERSVVFYCQLQLTHTLNTGSLLTAVNNLSFGLNTQSCKQPNTSWVCLKKQLRILVSLIAGHCCLNKHLHRMGLATSPVCASCQLEKETALHFLCVCLTLATLRTRIFGKPIVNASEFTEVSASAIVWFAFQSGRLETNLWHNSLKCASRLLIYDSSN
jgi:hypothetical protein